MLPKDFGDKRGISTIVGAIFIVLITMFSLNAIFWVMTQENSYTEAARQMNDLNTDRFSENLQFTNPAIVNFTETGDNEYEFDLVVSNLGGVAIKIVRIYIYNNNSDILTILDKQENITSHGIANCFLDSGELNSRVYVKADRNICDGNQYTIKTVTERGRIFTAQYQFSESEETDEQLALGNLRLDLTYTSVNYTSTSQPTPTPGWVVPGGEGLVWYVTLTNAGGDNLTILGDSVFYAMEFKASGNPVPIAFFVVDSNTNYPGGTPGVVAYNETANPYVLPSDGSEVVVKFSSSTVGGTTPRSLTSATRYLVFIGLYYEINDEERGVNIPFVAIRTT
jgi:hypothetical protein